MTQNAVVTKIIDSRLAEVAIQRGTACGGNCGKCGATCSFKNVIHTLALNRICASVGDNVTVASGTAKVLRSAALIYIFPLVMLFVGYAVSAFLEFGEGASIAICMLFFFISVLAVVISQRVKNRQKPVTCEIIDVN